MEQATDVTPAPAPSTEAIPSDINLDLDTFTPEQRAEWKAGKYPTKSAGADAASVTGESQPGAAKAESTRDPATGKFTQTNSGEQPTRADARKAQLNVEIRGLLDQRNRLHAEVNGKSQNGNGVTRNPPTESAKPAEAADLEPKEPNEGDFTTWEEYRKADRKYQREVAQWEARQLLKADKAEKAETATRIYGESQQQRYFNQLSEHEKAAAEKYPDYESKSAAAEAAIKATPSRAIIEYVTDATNPRAAEVLYSLGDDPALVAEIAAMSYPRAVAALARIEESLAAPPTPESKPFVRPVITRAPAKTSSVNGGGTPPADPELAALAAGDVRAFKRLANERDAKRMR